jgi:hypothetical protein
MSVFLVVFLVVFTFFSSHNEVQAAVVPSIALGVSSVVAIAALLSLAGFSFSSRDAAFVMSKSIYDDMDSSSKSALETTLQTMKGLHELPGNVLKLIYDLAKVKLGLVSLSASYSDVAYESVSQQQILDLNYIPYVSLASGSKITPITGGYIFYDSYYDRTKTYSYSTASWYRTEIFYDTSFNDFVVHVTIGDSSGKYLHDIRYRSTSVSVGNLVFIYPDTTINPSTDVILPSGIDTDSLAQKIASGEAGSISAPLYPSDSVLQSQSASDVLNTYLDIVLKNVSSLVDTNVQTLSIVKAISVAVSNVLSAVNFIATTITTGLVGDLSSIDFSEMTKNISIAIDKFPFSIPWDLKRVLSVFDVPVQSPNFKIGFPDFRGGTIEYTFDFSWFDNYIGIVRTLEIISFDFLLIFVARRLANPDR